VTHTSKALVLVSALLLAACGGAAAQQKDTTAASSGPGAHFGPYVAAVPVGYTYGENTGGQPIALLGLEGEREAHILLSAGKPIRDLPFEDACRGYVEGFATGFIGSILNEKVELDIKRFEVLPGRDGFSRGCQTEASIKGAKSADYRVISSVMDDPEGSALVLCLLTITEAESVSECQAVLAGVRRAGR
jgi:hypothetical protein